jgi:TrpR-related protein YerC/YecD
MARFRDIKIPKPTQDEVWNEFCDVVHKLRSGDDIRRFLRDLLNRQERLMLARRLQVAKMLQAGASYTEIVDALGVGKQTISRVQRWLNFGRDGYMRAARALGPANVETLKRKYSTYYRRKTREFHGLVHGTRREMYCCT